MKCHSFLAATLAGSLVLPASAGELKQARITQIYNEVKTLSADQQPHPSKLQETIEGSTAVHTGVSSRTELTFSDETLTRLGANTIFSFKEGTRDLSLKEGTLLLHVPKGLGGARIRTSSVTAGITGTTVMLEVFPNNSIKFIVLEGTAKLYLNGSKEDPIIVTAGQMVILPAHPKSLAEAKVVSVDINKIVATSALIEGMKNPKGIELLTGSPLPIYNSGVTALQVQDLATQARQPRPTPTPPPPPRPIRTPG